MTTSSTTTMTHDYVSVILLVIIINVQVSEWTLKRILWKLSFKSILDKVFWKSILNYPKNFVEVFLKYKNKILFKSILKIQNKIVFSILKIKYYFQNTIVPNTVGYVDRNSSNLLPHL